MSTAAAIPREECAKRLVAIAGQEQVRVKADALAVSPADAAQIAEILRFANANGVVLTTEGSATKAGWGNPVDAGIHLDMKRMNKLREHAWQDMTCTVEAGCTWAAMQAELARHGQMVALDPLWPQHATVGGVVASNDSGALRLKYGGLRDLIIGMTVVLADGTIAKTGGKVVKNVAGYDLHKLITGSLGTLGVIAEVNFRVHPVESHAVSWTAAAADALLFDVPLRTLLDAQINPSAVQLRVRGRECALDVRVAALRECMDVHASRLKTIFDPIELNSASATVWQARQDVADIEGALLLKIASLPSDICSLLSAVNEWRKNDEMEIAVVAQATGLMTLAVKSTPEMTLALFENLRSKVVGAGGSVVALRVPEQLRGRVDVWGCDSSALPLMREIKRRFDPNRILNPGRFAGSI